MPNGYHDVDTYTHSREVNKAYERGKRQGLELARELYEELKFADRAVHEERGTGDYQPCDAIARYEKEIGE